MRPRDDYDIDLWHNAVGQLPDGQSLSRGVGDGEISDCDELGSTPGINANIGQTLTFPGTETGLPLDCIFYSPNGPLIYNDNELSASTYPHLSIGEVNDRENDDFEITVTRVDPGYSLLAMGIMVIQNVRESGENLRVYGEGNLLLYEFSGEDLPSGTQFMGVVSAIPLTRIRFDEHPGDDDIATGDFHFGVSSN